MKVQSGSIMMHAELSVTSYLPLVQGSLPLNGQTSSWFLLCKGGWGDEITSPFSQTFSPGFHFSSPTSHSEVWNCPKCISKIDKFKADTGFSQINYRQGLNFLLNVTQEGIKSPSSYVIFPVLSQTDLINGS